MEILDVAIDFIAFLYALLFFPAPFFWLVIHPAIRFWRRFGRQAYWVALPVWAGFGSLLFFFRGDILGNRLERTISHWILGLILVALGIWLNRQVRRQFTWRRLIGLPEINPRKNPGGVVRSGIYGWMRHPRYMEFVLTFAGLAFLTSAPGIFVLAILTFLMYLIVAPLEERELRQQYGDDYAVYAREVPRFLPRLRRRS
jgi:protein-S-isoprenylcysteine O-methyltransferase Ste14